MPADPADPIVIRAGGVWRYSYADKSRWSADGKANAPVKKYLDQLVADLFRDGSVPEILSDAAAVERVKSLWNGLTHGNIPITLEVIDEAKDQLKPLEDAAFSILQQIRECKLTCDTIA